MTTLSVPSNDFFSKTSARGCYYLGSDAALQYRSSLDGVGCTSGCVVLHDNPLDGFSADFRRFCSLYNSISRKNFLQAFDHGITVHFTDPYSDFSLPEFEIREAKGLFRHLSVGLSGYEPVWEGSIVPDDDLGIFPFPLFLDVPDKDVSWHLVTLRTSSVILTLDSDVHGFGREFLRTSGESRVHLLVGFGKTRSYIFVLPYDEDSDEERCEMRDYVRSYFSEISRTVVL